MKKIVLTIVAMLSMTMAFAENENVNVTESYNMQINTRVLTRTLGLSADQAEAVNGICDAFTRELRNASHAKGDKRDKRVTAAVNRNLRYMHSVLDTDQFKVYRRVLNATFVNRNIALAK